MIAARRVFRAGTWPGDAADRIALDYDLRHRRRRLLTSAGGIAILLDLREPVTLRDGDGLVLDDGRIVRVEAVAEPLAEIVAADAAALTRIAWHLGNRHLPTQLTGNRLRIRRDHVIEAMVEGLGGRVTLIDAPFDPEAGAYAHGHGAAESGAA